MEQESLTDYEYCPRCNAILSLQKGYSNDLPYWICRGCGEMLINPEVEGDIAWICDGCGAMLNIQAGFREDCGVWRCTACGTENRIDESEMYASEDEYQAAARDPYKGLTGKDALELSLYEEVEGIGDRGHVVLMRQRETGLLYVKKLLTFYDKSIYDYLIQNPVPHMPRIVGLYETDNALIVVEEYVKGTTVEASLEKGAFAEEEALRIACQVCEILEQLHGLPVPIVHRDVKPSNVMLTPDREVVLLDMNAAKWYDPDETDDTRYLGTPFYAAPEQAGYGLTASSGRSDVYAVGILLNVMLTGTYPKDKRPGGDLWEVIEGCIRLDPGSRYSMRELRDALYSRLLSRTKP